MATVGVLNTLITADSSQFQKEIAKTSKETAALAAKMNQSRSGKFQKGIDSLAAAFPNVTSAGRTFFDILGPGGIALGVAAVGVFKYASALNQTQIRMAQTADQSLQFSKRIGANFEEMQKLEIINNRAGNSFQTLQMGLQRMTRRVSEAAKGTGEAVKALKELGLSANNLNLLTADQQFKEIAIALELVEGQSDKVRLAMKLFDSEGVALVNTTANLDENLRRLERSGAAVTKVLSEADAKVFADLNASAQDLADTMDGFFKDQAIGLAGTKTLWNEFLTDVIRSANRTKSGLSNIFDIFGTNEAERKGRMLDKKIAEANADLKKQAGIEADKQLAEKLKKEKKATELLDKQVEATKKIRAIQESGKSPLKKALDEFNLLLKFRRELGASGAEFDAVLAAVEKKIDRLSDPGIVEAEKTKEFVDRLIKDALSPLVVLNKQLTRIAEAQRRNAITAEQAAKASNMLRTTFAKERAAEAAKAFEEEKKKRVAALDKQIAAIDKLIKDAPKAVGFAGIVGAKVATSTLNLAKDRIAFESLQIQKEQLKTQRENLKATKNINTTALAS